MIELEMFDNNQAKEFLKANLSEELTDSDLKEKGLNEFLENFFQNENNNNKILPLMLKLVVGLLNENKLITLNNKQRNENMSNDVYTELAVYLLIEDIDVESLEFRIITTLINLDGSSIDFNFFNYLLGEENKENAIDFVRKYDKKCLITIRKELLLVFTKNFLIPKSMLSRLFETLYL